MWESEYKRADETTSIYLAGIETNVSMKTSRLRANNMAKMSENRRTADHKRTSDQGKRCIKCTQNKFCSLRRFNFNKGTLIQRHTFTRRVVFLLSEAKSFFMRFLLKKIRASTSDARQLVLDQTISDGSYIYSMTCHCPLSVLILSQINFPDPIRICVDFKNL